MKEGKSMEKAEGICPKCRKPWEPEAARHHLSPVWVKSSEPPKKLLESYYCQVFSAHFEKVFRKMVLITLDGTWQTGITSDKVLFWLDEHPSSLTGDAVKDEFPDRCRFCGTPVAKGFNICMGCHNETRGSRSDH